MRLWDNKNNQVVDMEINGNIRGMRCDYITINREDLDSLLDGSDPESIVNSLQNIRSRLRPKYLREV